MLPEWRGTLWTYWNCQWCTIFGILAHYLTLLLCPRQARVFLDIACIDQRSEDDKIAGLVSMGAVLKSSKSMVVLWCPSYVTRLWCIFELSAFLHSQKTQDLKHRRANLKVCPPMLGPTLMVTHVSLSVTAMIYLSLRGSFGDSTVFIGGAVAIPLFCLTFYSARAYFRSIDVLEGEVRNLSIETLSPL